jgi:cytochrome P450
MNVIADMVGIPEADRAWLFSLANEFLQADTPGRRLSPEKQLELQVQLFEYAQTLGQMKRSDPQDDVWTILSTVEVETDDGGLATLSQIELDLFFLLLIVAGSETTRNAVSQGLLALLDHPDQLERLRQEPGAIPLAVEEILRWSSPVVCFARRATRDTEIRGMPIAEGDRVTMWYPSANRDEDIFDDPFRFDTRRSPNPHAAFGGGGVHFCLGAHVARAQLRAIFSELMHQLPGIQAGDPVYLAGNFIHGIRSMPCTF